MRRAVSGRIWGPGHPSYLYTDLGIQSEKSVFQDNDGWGHVGHPIKACNKRWPWQSHLCSDHCREDAPCPLEHGCANLAALSMENSSETIDVDNEK